MAVKRKGLVLSSPQGSGMRPLGSWPVHWARSDKEIKESLGRDGCPTTDEQGTACGISI